MKRRRGRPLGVKEISNEDIAKIIFLTILGGMSRRKIAENVKHSTQTVYRYQKKYLYSDNPFRDRFNNVIK